MVIEPYHYRYKSISVKERDYLVLSKKKQTVESAIKRHLSWSEFLLLIAGLKSVAEEERISRLALGEPANEEFERPLLSGASQLEEIVARQVEMAIRGMKKHR
jgi:hypothetical protein